MEIQLDLFFEKTEMDMLREEIQHIKETTANVRRGLFARHNELAKKWVEAQMDIEELRVQLAQLRNEK